VSPAKDSIIRISITLLGVDPAISGKIKVSAIYGPVGDYVT
jgi:hypothetical protein